MGCATSLVFSRAASCSYLGVEIESVDVPHFDNFFKRLQDNEYVFTKIVSVAAISWKGKKRSEMPNGLDFQMSSSSKTVRASASEY